MRPSTFIQNAVCFSIYKYPWRRTVATEGALVRTRGSWHAQTFAGADDSTLGDGGGGDDEKELPSHVSESTHGSSHACDKMLPEYVH